MHRVVELKALGQCNMAPPAKTGTRVRVLSDQGLGTDIASLVPYLGDTLGVVGIKKVLKE